MGGGQERHLPRAGLSVPEQETPTALAVSARATDLARRRADLAAALRVTADGLSGLADDRRVADPTPV